MNNADNEKLRQIQLTQIEILNELRSICEEHDLKYCLVYGSMLGAIRHKGFIPWDDDLDVVMPYKDSRKLNNYLNNRDFFFQTEYTDKKMPFISYKLRKNNTKMVEEHLADMDMHNGIWIDVFMYVSASRTKTGKKLQYVLRKLLLVIRTKYYRKTYNIRGGINAIIIRIPDAIRFMIERILTWLILVIGSKKSNEYFVFQNTTYERTFINKKYFDETIDYQFEGQMFCGIKDYDGYLKKMYGNNYMTPVVYPSHTNLDEVII